MYLLVAATEEEIGHFRQLTDRIKELDILVTGVGPLATAVKLTRYLTVNSSLLSGVVNIGVGGAYPGSGLDILDVCMASQEVMGDFGICMEGEIVDLNPAILPVQKKISLESPLLSKVEKIMKSGSLSYNIVNFVTVNCCSGTKERGAYLRSRYQAACENMEGAAVAFACHEFQVPCVEIRCISNMVEDRNTKNWQLTDACKKVCNYARIVLESLINRHS
jgi:futalosine hydrolase